MSVSVVWISLIINAAMLRWTIGVIKYSKNTIRTDFINCWLIITANKLRPKSVIENHMQDCSCISAAINEPSVRIDSEPIGGLFYRLTIKFSCHRTGLFSGVSAAAVNWTSIQTIDPPPMAFRAAAIRPLTRWLNKFCSVASKYFGKVFNVACEMYLFIRRLIA